ncbi:MAG: hypothetical protein KatS3mg111_2901 [Pirellulaceae bacterium]|nr:MAG: hypothetical protein KatS3mg111_2901 [Pirellulaceae bacterium]
MVRLRRDRWYAADGQRRIRQQVASQVAGRRRLFSLCLLLALVVLLMQRAQDPRYISGFFAALGVPLESPQVRPDAAEQAPAAVASPSLADAAPRPIRSLHHVPGPASDAASEFKELWEQLFGALTDDQVRLLGLYWFAMPHAADGQFPWDEVSTTDLGIAPAVDTPEFGERLREIVQPRLAQWHASLSTADARWVRVLEQFEAQVDAAVWRWIDQVIASRFARTAEASPTPSTSPSSLPETMSQASQALTDWLDQRLARTFVEASPWKKRDGVAFWRFLQRVYRVGRPNSGDSRPGPLLGTSQLMADSARWRGVEVMFRGQVHRLEQGQRGFSLFAVPGYAIAWVRGADRAVQPVPIYLPRHVAEQLTYTAGSEPPWERTVQFSAIVGKRLAYAAPAGLQVTTTLFAREGVFLPQAAATAPTQAPFLWRPYLVAMIVSGIVAVGIVVSLMRGRARSNGLPRGAGQASAASRRGRWLAVLPLGVMWGGTLLATVGGLSPVHAVQDSPTQAPWRRTDAQHRRLQLLRQRVQDSVSVGELIDLAGQDQGPDEAVADAILKLLQMIEQFGVPSLPPDSPILIGAPYELRRIALTGWCHAVVAKQLSQRQRDWYAADADRSVYRVEGEFSGLGVVAGGPPGAMDASGARPVVWAAEVPRFWLGRQALKQPLAVDGWGVWDAQRRVYVAVLCRRVRWSFQRQQIDQCAPPLPDAWKGVAAVGWDLAWLDVIRRNNSRLLQREEASALYSLLAAVEREARQGLVQQVDPAVDPMLPFADAEENILRPIRWTVRLVSGKVVQLEEPEDQRLLGASRYFQLDGFVDLGGRTILYRTPEMPPGEQIEFSGEFPVTLLVRTPNSFIPEAVREGRVVGWEIGSYAQVRGRFYRLWAYRSELLEERDGQGRQLAPLVVVSALTPTMPAVRSSADSVWFTLALALVLLAILGGIVASVARGTRWRRRARYK